ncbi:MAG: RibD family protein [Bacteroidota bacterium]
MSSNKTWEAMLRIKEATRNHSRWPERILIGADATPSFCTERCCNDSLAVIDVNAKASSCFENDFIDVHLPKTSQLSRDDARMLELYLPYALVGVEARTHRRSIAISHFAQTLDGRIASDSGDSKWIGNEDNLTHAHRMRALCDAILIGSKTLEVDNPRLNVRLVEGSSPIRVIIGGDELCVEEYQAVDKDTILFCQNHSASSHVNKVTLLRDERYATKEILQELFRRGLHSVYIEGGCYTTSSFLTQGMLDQIQLHISPMILGSGRSSFEFPGAEDMSGALRFKTGRFVDVGADVMFVGSLA